MKHLSDVGPLPRQNDDVICKAQFHQVTPRNPQIKAKFDAFGKALDEVSKSQGKYSVPHEGLRAELTSIAMSKVAGYEAMYALVAHPAFVSQSKKRLLKIEPASVHDLLCSFVEEDMGARLKATRGSMRAS